MNSEFKQGLKDGIPIALGYLSVSFSFGILALKGGMSVFQSVLTSITNVTSAGQLAGIEIIVAGGTIFEMILTQFIINLRYALMSLSLSQKLSPDVKPWHRVFIAFANTDEVFALAMAHNKDLSFKYMAGLEILPVIGWASGTAVGALVCGVLPKTILSALSVALYAMFIAIVVPAAKISRPVMTVALIALILSCIIYYVPIFNKISAGVSIIICTVIASAIGAYLFPTYDKNEENGEGGTHK